MTPQKLPVLTYLQVMHPVRTFLLPLRPDGWGEDEADREASGVELRYKVSELLGMVEDGAREPESRS